MTSICIRLWTEVPLLLHRSVHCVHCIHRANNQFIIEYCEFFFLAHFWAADGVSMKCEDKREFRESSNVFVWQNIFSFPVFIAVCFFNFAAFDVSSNTCCTIFQSNLVLSDFACRQMHARTWTLNSAERDGKWAMTALEWAPNPQLKSQWILSFLSLFSSDFPIFISSSVFKCVFING